jgi:hypothetical protein
LLLQFLLKFSEEEVLVALPVRLEVNTKGMDFAVHLTGNSSFVVVETVELLVPLAVSTKEMGSANQMITNNSFMGVGLAVHLAHLGLSTRGMVSAEATSFSTCY